MLPSTEREYQEKIKQAEHKSTEQFYLGLRKALGVAVSAYSFGFLVKS